MIIYNITVKVATEANEEWLKWMRETHIPEMMATGLFTEHRMSRLLEQDDSEGPTYAIQFYTATAEDYNIFQSRHQRALRQKGYDRFGDRFIAFTTVMEVL
jgi:hypothetical protein